MTEPRRPADPVNAGRRPATHRTGWLQLLLRLVPLLVALVSVGLVAGQVQGHGPEITLTFLDGEGIEPGKTPVKYNEVGIGTVTAVRLSADRSHVVVAVRLKPEAADFAAKGSRFWIVRPRAGASGISGLGTLLSGTYIGADASGSDETETQFAGLEAPPADTFRQQGSRFVLHSQSLGSIDTGAPVYYRHVEVGRVTGTALDEDGMGARINVFVDAPYHRYVGANTQWLHASGFGLRLDTAGLRLDAESIRTLLLGGIAFQSPPGQPVEEAAPSGTVFSLMRRDVAPTEGPDGTPAVVVMLFDQSLRGLSVGAAVDFRGVQLGEVTEVGMERDPQTAEFIMPVTVKLYPDRLGQAFRASSEYGDATAGKALLRTLVARGLRGQLRTGNLLTNQLYVALDMFPNAPPVQLDLNRTPIAMPTLPNTLDDLQAEIADLMKTLDRMPVDPMRASFTRSLKTARRLFAQVDTQLAPQARGTLAAAQDAFDAAQAALQSPSLPQAEWPKARGQLLRARQSLDTLADIIAQHPESLVGARPRMRGLKRPLDRKGRAPVRHRGATFIMRR